MRIILKQPRSEMRSTNANKLSLLTLLILISACHYKPEQEMISGDWKYISITKADSPAIDIMDSDFLRLSPDSSFEYHIGAVKKDMKGTWDYNDHTLHLHYQAPDTMRHFGIDLLTKYRLQFHEGDMVFTFTRIE
jgi:hypothetical protein